MCPLLLVRAQVPDPRRTPSQRLHGLREYITLLILRFVNEPLLQVNLIHLAMLSGRIPILPPFVPSSAHLGKSGNITNVSEFFDLPRLREELQWPILEWSDVKRARYGDSVDAPALEEVIKEPLGCWSFWMSNTESKKAAW